MRTKEALAARKAEGQKLGRKEGYCPKYAVLVENENLIRGMIEKGAPIDRFTQNSRFQNQRFINFIESLKYKVGQSQNLYPTLYHINLYIID